VAGRHHIDSDSVHYGWDRTLAPALTVDAGDEVTFEARGGSDNYYRRDSTTEDVRRRPPSRGHALTGPVFIRGATPGAVLEIELVSMKTWDWGHTFVTKGLGLLPEDFDEPFLKIWDLSSGVSAQFKPGIEIPIEPFLGVVGLAPADSGSHSTMPPRRVGGNLDIKHLTVGSTLWLPIEVDGALLSVGDSHAAQGDGEVCVTAIETGSTATLRLRVRHDLSLATPEYRTAGPITPRTNVGAWHATTGIAPDLMTATKEAVRAMLRYLQREHALTAHEAYVLASVVVDLKISEVVDAPNWLVSACLPLSIFKSA
jgi:acetamidase/formamidase